MKDIEKGTKKQQEDKAALQRFNEKWKLFKPQHQDQEKDDERETEDNGNHETRSDGLRAGHICCSPTPGRCSSTTLLRPGTTVGVATPLEA